MIAGMISNNIRISPMTIGKLLKEERLEVPPNQRSYLAYFAVQLFSPKIWSSMTLT